MADAGYRLTVEGEAEFKRALADINAQVKLNKSEINALTAEYNANGGSLETLQQKQAALGKEMEAQQQKVDLMRQRLEDAKAAYGENSAQVTKLQTDLNNATGALETMRKQYQDTRAQIEDATHSTASYDEAVKQAEAAIAAEKAAMDNLAAAYKGADDKAGNLAEQNKSLTAQVNAQQKKVDALNAAMKTAADRYGAGSTEAQKYREQVAKAEGELGKMKTALDKSTKAMKDQSGASGGLLDGLKGLADQFGVKLPGSMDKLLEGFGSLAGPAGAAGLIGVLGEVIGKVNELGDAAMKEAAAMKDLSDQTGMSTAKLDELHYAVSWLGGDTAALDNALVELGKKMYEAKTKGGESEQMFGKLGVQVEDMNGELRSSVDVFLDVIDGLKLYDSEVERSAIAEKLLGSSAKSLTGILEETSDNIRFNMKMAREEAGLMSDGMVDALDKIEKKLGRTETAAHNWHRALGVSFKAWLSGDAKLSDEADSMLWKAFQNYVGEAFYGLTHAYARGTSYHPGGLALVGEQGPEIVELPRGSAVYPTGTAPAGTTNNYYDVKIDASRIRELNDIVRIAENERVSRRMGVAR